MTEEGREGRGKCPICGAAAEQRWRPFCSRRCADVDLSRWLKGVYAVPVVEPDEDDDDEALEAELSEARRPPEEGGGP